MTEGYNMARLFVLYPLPDRKRAATTDLYGITDGRHRASAIAELIKVYEASNSPEDKARLQRLVTVPCIMLKKDTPDEVKWKVVTLGPELFRFHHQGCHGLAGLNTP